MAKLINAPYMKKQDPTGQSLVTICLGVQAMDIAKHFNEMGISAEETALSQALHDGENKRFPCVVVDSEILESIELYQIAPKNTRSIRLICANNGVTFSNEMMERVYIQLVKTTSAETVTYCTETGELIEDVSGYISRLRAGNTYHGEVKAIDKSYSALFAKMADSERVQEFLKWAGELLKVDSLSGLPYLWTGKKWQWLSKKDLGQQIRDFFNEKDVTYDKRKIDNLISLMVDYDLDPMGKRNPHLLGFSNGVLNKQTGEFLPHAPEFYLTSFIEIDYTDKPTDTPNFNKWLNWVSDGDNNKAQRILAGLYMILTNRHDWQLFLEITGVGGSGKSIFNEIAKMLAGEDNSTVISLKDLESETARAKLIDKTLFYSSDQEYYAGDGAELRAITGGDSISVRVLYSNPFDIRINAIYMMTNNKIVTFKENNGGIARRRVIFHFNKQVPQAMRDSQLKDKLQAESAGIVRLLLDTFKDSSLAEKLLLEQRESMESLEVKQQTDHVLDFCRHFQTKEMINGLRLGSPKQAINAERKHLYSAYLFYCDCMGFKKHLTRPQFITAFKQAMKESGNAHEVQTRKLGGVNITNVYYLDTDQTLNEWRG